MKIKLSYKIFAVFLMTSVIVAVLMAGTYRHLVLRNFWDFVNHSVLSRLDGFSQTLIEEYRAGDGWQHLQENPELWFRIMDKDIPSDDVNRQPPSPNDPGDPEDSGKPRETIESEKIPPDRAPHPPPRRFRHSLALFDAHKRFVTGGMDATRSRDYTLRPLSDNGRTIGWLGLYKIGLFSDPLVKTFMKHQSQAFYYTGFVILGVAALVSFLLSRHLLAPIRQLTKGTRALTSFKFDTLIPVQSDDEMGQLARDFNHMADTLKKYEDLRRRWISDISHELRTPLSIIAGEIEALQDGIRPMDQASLASLHAETLRLSKLVADLHDLSLADTRNLLAAKDQVLPLDILQRMVNNYHGPIQRQGIAVRLCLGDDRPLLMEGDADRLARLFTNLLENSLRYTDSPGTLSITARREHQRLVILFEDSAPGVPDESKERIFERLYRLDDSRNRNLGGSGLGLAICREIVAAHGGIIRATDSDLGGLGIRIELPLKGAAG